MFSEIPKPSIIGSGEVSEGSVRPDHQFKSEDLGHDVMIDPFKKMTPRMWTSPSSVLRFPAIRLSKALGLPPCRTGPRDYSCGRQPIRLTTLGVPASFSTGPDITQGLFSRHHSAFSSLACLSQQSPPPGSLSRGLRQGKHTTIRLSNIDPPHSFGKAYGVRWLASGPSGNGSGNRPQRPGKVPLTKKLLTRLTPHENIYTLPNILTFSRLIAAPLVGYFIATSQHTLALSLFFYAGVTDLVDGYIARRYNMQTVVGSVIDPMADKALMTISVIALAMRNAIPWWLASIILLRDVGLGIAAVYYRWISLPPPKTMARYWDFSLPSAEVKPTQISKYNTFLQLLLVGAGVALPVLPTGIVHEWNMDLAFQGFQYLVALTTVWSGASYAYSKDAVKILTQDEVEERLANKKKREQP